jgi:chitin synthase
MYNEDDGLFLRTLNSVIKNIAHLTTRTRSKTWGTESWQKVVVCIVADGRTVIDSRVLKILQLMGVYAEVSSSSFRIYHRVRLMNQGVMKDTVMGKETRAHIFE